MDFDTFYKNRFCERLREKIDKVMEQNEPINKRTGEQYTIEYRDVDVNLSIEDC